MTRFALDRETAVARVLKAVESTKGGEIFVIKMKSLRIRDLAQAMIEEVSRTQGKLSSSVQIQVGGIRPGEKIHEELMTEDEAANCRETSEFYVITPRTIANKTTKGKRRTPGPYTSKEGPFMNKEEIRSLLKASEEIAIGSD
jgi:FlaA1/EpsC-like NDP-sugar epimerase